jgi:hypothetical protein
MNYFFLFFFSNSLRHLRDNISIMGRPARNFEEDYIVYSPLSEKNTTLKKN